MQLAPTPFFDIENVTVAHYGYVEKFLWSVPNDFDPTDIPDYKTAYTSVIRYLITLKQSHNSLMTAMSELEKYAQWALRVKNKHLLKCNDLDLIEYFDFIRSPYSTWISQASYKKYIVVEGKRTPNPKWRPFSKPRGTNINPGTIKKAYTWVSLYYGFCLKQKFIKVNPMDFIDSKSITPTNTGSEVSKKTLWPEDRELLERVLIKMVEADLKHTRERFIIVAMLNMYLRVSDLAIYKGVIPVMCDLFFRRDSGWWLTVYGKRNKKGDIPANEAVMDALKDYRAYLGLSDYPAAYDETPLLSSINGTKAITSTRHIRDLVSGIILNVIAEAEKLGWSEEELTRLRSFTTHWLRHTGISDGVRGGRPLSHVQLDARHGSLATTSIYIESDDIERHKSS